MAYPSSPYSVTPVSNGQTIDASRDNAQDAELTALTGAVLSGFAHALTVSTGGLTVSTGSVNVGGPSSLTTLQVNGGSTFVGSVTFSSLVTFSTGLTERPEMPPPQLVLLTGSTSQFANGSSGGVSWPTQSAITNSSMHSTGSNPDRVIPQSTGVFALSVSLTLSTAFADPSSGALDISIKDSSGGLVDFQRQIGSAGGRAPSVAAFGMKHIDTIAAGPYLRVVLVQRGGSTHSLDGARSFLRCYKL